MTLRRTQYWNLNGPNPTPVSGPTSRAESRTDVEEYLLPLDRARSFGRDSWGVTSGLQVSAVTGSGGVSVSTGTALDAQGRIAALVQGGLAVTDPLVGASGVQNIPTVGVGPQGVELDCADRLGALLVTLTWREVEQVEAGLLVLAHAPWLRLVAEADFVPDGLQLVLAAVTCDEVGVVTALAPGSRQVAGSTTGRLELRLPAGSDAGVSDVAAATLAPGPAGGVLLTPVAGPVIVAGNLVVDAHVTLQYRLSVEGALKVGQSLVVGTSVDVGGGLRVAGGAKVVDELSVGGSLDVGGSVMVNGSLGIRGREAIVGTDPWLRLNQANGLPNGVRTPRRFSSGSLNVGGLNGWGDPGAGNAWIAGGRHVQGAVTLGAADETVRIGGNRAGDLAAAHRGQRLRRPRRRQPRRLLRRGRRRLGAGDGHSRRLGRDRDRPDQAPGPPGRGRAGGDPRAVARAAAATAACCTRCLTSSSGSGSTPAGSSGSGPRARPGPATSTATCASAARCPRAGAGS